MQLELNTKGNGSKERSMGKEDITIKTDYNIKEDSCWEKSMEMEFFALQMGPKFLGFGKTIPWKEKHLYSIIMEIYLKEFSINHKKQDKESTNG